METKKRRRRRNPKQASKSSGRSLQSGLILVQDPVGDIGETLKLLLLRLKKVRVKRGDPRCLTGELGIKVAGVLGIFLLSWIKRKKK